MLQQIFDGKTDTGASDAVLVDRGGPRGNDALIGVHLNGITTGTVQFQVAPTSTGAWETPTDGEFTADGYHVTTVPDGWHVRLNVSVATSIDLDAWIGPLAS